MIEIRYGIAIRTNKQTSKQASISRSFLYLFYLSLFVWGNSSFKAILIETLYINISFNTRFTSGMRSIREDVTLHIQRLHRG